MKAEKPKFYFSIVNYRDRTKQEWIWFMARNGLQHLTVFEREEHVKGEAFSEKFEAAQKFEVLELVNY